MYERVDFYSYLLCLLSMSTVNVLASNEENKNNVKSTKRSKNEQKAKKKLRKKCQNFDINTMELISKYNKEMF